MIHLRVGTRKEYDRAAVALRNKALMQYARDKRIPYQEAIRRENFILTTYEPYLWELKKLERAYVEKTVAHYEKQKKDYNIKALKRRQERENKREEKQNKLEGEKQKRLEEEQQKSLEEEKQNKLEEEKQKKLEEEKQKKLEEEKQKKLEEEKQKRQEEEKKKKLAEEKQRRPEKEKQNVHYNSVNVSSSVKTQGIAKKTVNSKATVTNGKKPELAFTNVLKVNPNISELIIIDDDEAEPEGTLETLQQREIHTNASMNSNQCLEINLINMDTEDFHNEENDVNEENEELLPGNHSPNTDSFNYSSTTQKIRIRNVEQVIDFLKKSKDSQLDSSTNINSKGQDITKNVSKSNPGVLTIHINAPIELRVIIFPQNAKKDKYKSTMNQKFPQTVEQIHRDDFAASIRNDSSNCIVPDCSNIHGQNNLQKPYTHDTSFYEKCTLEKQLHNVTKSTKALIDQLNNAINDFNLTFNHIRNYDSSFKENPTAMEIKPTSPDHDDLREICENFNQEVKGDGKADAQVVDLLDMYLSTETEDARSNGPHCLQAPVGSQAETGQRQARHPSSASEGMDEGGERLKGSDALQTFTDDVNAANGPGMVIPEAEGYNEEAGLETRNAKANRMEICDSDAESERRADVGMFKSTVGNESEGTDENTLLTELINQAVEELTFDCAERAEVEMTDSVMETGSTQRYDVEAMDTMNQYINEKEYEQPEEMNSEGYQEIFYDDIFFSNVEPAMYDYGL